MLLVGQCPNEERKRRGGEKGTGEERTGEEKRGEEEKRGGRGVEGERDKQLIRPH